MSKKMKSMRSSASKQSLVHPEFKYRSSWDTDIRSTFRRVQKDLTIVSRTVRPKRG